MKIVEVAATHHTAVALLNRATFGGDAECELISRLREEGLGLVERVALDRVKSWATSCSVASSSRSMAGL